MKKRIQEIFNRTGIQITEQEATFLEKNGNPYLASPYCKPTAKQCRLIEEGVSPELGCPIHIGCSCSDCLDSYRCEYGYQLENAQQIQAWKEQAERDRLAVQAMFADS